MRRGERPPIALAFAWTFLAGVTLAIGALKSSPTHVACGLGFVALGPAAWFVGRP